MKKVKPGFSHLSDLVDSMMECLATAPPGARVFAAKLLYVDPRREDLLEAIKEALGDPYLSGHVITTIGSIILRNTITYQENSVVYIADPDDPEDTAERAIATATDRLDVWNKASG
ncbi:hypothetical protein [Rhizobium ruizarguesonis]|jgi:hypothetical protein|uniref:hypothetical protein n=1 Tax=Rhizobium ruizarguesonis TaxID=2081791 RepID=UPI0010311665|nr:hypothetical protein [Rhizobium ruizarguesonis]TBF31541.1 hypothetical protein ELG93_14955 [Rhizobium ruizarguesonis]